MKAIYSGSFDPITVGHVDIATRAGQMFDLTIGVAKNPDKSGMFHEQAKVNMIKKSIENIDVLHFSDVVIINGLLADYCKNLHIPVIVRGVRNSTDFEYEMTMQRINKDLGVDTIFIPANPKYSHISSSAVRQLTRLNSCPKNYVPKCVYKELLKI